MATMNLCFANRLDWRTPKRLLQLHRSCHSKTGKAHTTSDYCLQIVRANDHENFMCSLLLGGEVREAAFAVRAFNIEIAKVSDQTREKHIADMRMKFWFDALDSVYNKTPPKHPVALQLSRVVSKHNLHKRNLKRLITARADMPNLKFSSLSAMERYSEETVSPLYYLILQAAGSKSLEADHVGSHIGKAQGLVTLLRSLPHNIATRSLPLPSDLLAANKVSQESVFRAQITPELEEVVFQVASMAKLHLYKARSLLEKVEREHRVVFLPAVAVEAYLERLRNVGFDVFNSGLQRRNNLLGFKLLWNKLGKTY